MKNWIIYLVSVLIICVVAEIIEFYVFKIPYSSPLLFIARVIITYLFSLYFSIERRKNAK